MGPLMLDERLELVTFRRLTKEELEKLTIFGVEL